MLSFENVIASGWIRRNFLEDFPGNLLMENTNDYMLLIGSKNLVVSYFLDGLATVYLPIKSYDEGYTSVDWGDGSVDEYTFPGLDYTEYDPGSAIYIVSHTYAEASGYANVVISGDFYGLDNKMACEAGTNCWYQTHSESQTTEEGMVVEAVSSNYLERVISWGDRNYPSLNGVFYNAYKLEDLPNQRMPNVNYAMNTFNGCSSLVSLPSNFNLPYSLTNASGMFMNSGLSGNAVEGLKINSHLCIVDSMFQNCASLTEKPSGFYCHRYKNVDYTTMIDSSSAFVGTGVANPTLVENATFQY